MLKRLNNTKEVRKREIGEQKSEVMTKTISKPPYQ